MIRSADFLNPRFPGLLSFSLGNRKGGGKTHRAIFWRKTCCRLPPPKPILEGSENGIRLVCARFL